VHVVAGWLARGWCHKATDAPAPNVIWIGYLYMMRQMLVGFTEEKMQKIVSAILPFTSAATDTPVVEQARSTIGLLEHASNIFVLGQSFLSRHERQRN
jgi:hypothetical protein